MNLLTLVALVLVCFSAVWTILVFAVAIEGNRYNTRSNSDNRGKVPFFSDTIDYEPGMLTRAHLRTCTRTDAACTAHSSTHSHAPAHTSGTP